MHLNEIGLFIISLEKLIFYNCNIMDFLSLFSLLKKNIYPETVFHKNITEFRV